MVFPTIYFIADPSLYEGCESFFQAIQTAIDGGIRLIQYRDKSGQRGRIYEYAERLRALTYQSRVKLIINDEVDIALAVRADGVHLGQDDFPVAAARDLLGEQAIIGLSTHNLAEALSAEKESVDYIGFGPIFATETKKSEYLPLGVESIRGLCAGVKRPVYAIGGIQKPHIQSILKAGAKGVAVASALSGASTVQIRQWTAASEAGH